MAARRALREQRAAEKAAQELAEGAKKKPTPTQRRIAEEVAKALAEGIEIGKRMAQADLDAQQKATQGCAPSDPAANARMRT